MTVVAAFAALGAGRAAAQMSGIGPASMTGGIQPPFKDQRGQVKPPEPHAAALPGARPGLGSMPADKNAADLAPNEALFDAINRGDITSARDAVNRGAQIDAQNVLGMTPLELSVDLSRNDITFFLLSMRGTSADHHGQQPAVAVAEKTPEKTPAKPAAKRVALSTKAVAPKPNLAAMPRQYAGPSDPGTPVPEAGFLGFGRSLQ
ncbi:MAG: ankyrin repeat domain-containing protein [Alphaproteobacteria bacterium]|nr:ankyrin repeat domain-containing protein [Alphaproteobacteria bacterium]